LGNVRGAFAVESVISSPAVFKSSGKCDFSHFRIEQGNWTVRLILRTARLLHTKRSRFSEAKRMEKEEAAGAMTCSG
jgi:hypothetical protein